MLHPEKLSDLAGGGQKGSSPGWCTSPWEPVCVSLPTAEVRGYVLWLEIDHGGTFTPRKSASSTNQCCFFFPPACWLPWLPQLALVVKSPPASAGDLRDAGLIPGSGQSTGGGHGNPLQYSYLEDPTHRGAWWATVHAVAKSPTRQKRLSTHTCCLTSAALKL